METKKYTHILTSTETKEHFESARRLLMAKLDQPITQSRFISILVNHFKITYKQGELKLNQKYQIKTKGGINK